MKSRNLLFLVCFFACPAVIYGQTNVPAQSVAASATTTSATSTVTKQPDTKATNVEKSLSAQPVASAETVSAETKELEKDLAKASASTEKQDESFVAARETVEEETAEGENLPEKERIVYDPKTKRDPTLSPDDYLLIQHREQQRLAAIEAERQRKLDEERRKKEEAERLRQLELARIKDPTREVRNKIRIGGVIGQEVFIGSKIYTIGNSIYGARIVEVKPDEVVFSYKGRRFVRKVQL